MNTCNIERVETLQVADHVCIWDKTRWPFRYTHHGIVFEAGQMADEIIIAHVWSSKEDMREAHADSRFRLTSLTEFLNARPLKDMRLVQYNSSWIGNLMSELSETHHKKSDIPPVVIARCKFLLGLGAGQFSLIWLNCEHIAVWCKTGKVWSKQMFQKAFVNVPFVSTKANALLIALEAQIKTLQQENDIQVNLLSQLKGKRVYLEIGPTGTKFIKRLGVSQSLYAVHNDPKSSDLAFRHTPISFLLEQVYVKHNCVKVVLKDYITGEYLCSKAKCVKLLTKRAYHRDNLFEFEYSWNGELQSRRHRRWYVGTQTRDGLLRTFNSRDKAQQFKIVDADVIDKESVPIEYDTTSYIMETDFKDDCLTKKTKRLESECETAIVDDFILSKEDL